MGAGSGGHGRPCEGLGRSDASSSRCEIWGVLNVTLDSFSDGGLHFEPDAAIRHGARMLREGADVLDVGGESSRPAGPVYGQGAPRVPEDEERRRVLPVIERLVVEHGARVSIDTVKPGVARAALAAGARIVNDISGGRSPELLEVVADAAAELVLMHNRGRGEIRAGNTSYGDVLEEVTEELLEAVERAGRAGVARGQIWIDPGIGFAKTAEQSLRLLAGTRSLVETGLRVLVGPSRKSFIAELAPSPGGERPGAGERGGGTAASVAFAALAGARAVRVHDVVPMRQAVLLAEAMGVSPGAA